MMPRMVRRTREIVRWIADLREAERDLCGRYQIVPGYRHRTRTRYFDSTGLEEDWQREVYVAAADLARSQGFVSVYDVGCGSGYKLVRYFEGFETTGFDVEPTVSFLKRTYPDRQWREAPFTDRSVASADLVICSDVIEHVPDPDALLGFLEHVTGRCLVLSTPDRDLVYDERSPRHRGPPKNPTHIREWSSAEFRAYIEGRFEVLDHRITNRDQGTQMLVCRPRRA
jgi:SAM-dependent methyltransferase